MLNFVAGVVYVVVVVWFVLRLFVCDCDAVLSCGWLLIMFVCF